MTQDVPPSVPNLDALGFDLPTPEEGLVEAKRRFALTLRRSELAWLLQEQYDPLEVSELAELAGLPEREAHAIARRVLGARLAEARDRGLDTYTTYLSLKQRFEYA